MHQDKRVLHQEQENLGFNIFHGIEQSFIETIFVIVFISRELPWFRAWRELPSLKLYRGEPLKFSPCILVEWTLLDTEDKPLLRLQPRSDCWREQRMAALRAFLTPVPIFQIFSPNCIVTQNLWACYRNPFLQIPTPKPVKVNMFVLTNRNYLNCKTFQNLCVYLWMSVNQYSKQKMWNLS